MNEEYEILDLIANKMEIDWEESFNTIYFISNSYDEFRNLIETSIYFQFNFNNLNFYNFQSDYFKIKILNNNKIDFLLDLLNETKKYISHDKLRK